MKKKVVISLFFCIVFLIVLFLNHFYGWFIINDPTFNETYVSLRFDDGWKSQMNAYELLRKYNMSGSIYLISSFMGEEGYMDWKDVQEINDTLEIGGHTLHHVDLKNTLELEYEIGEDYRSLIGKGFNVSTFVYPYGNYDIESLNIVKKYYKCASTQDVGANTEDTDPYLLKDFTFRGRNDKEDIKRVIIPGMWTIITFHDVGEPYPLSSQAVKDNAISTEFFEEILKYLKDNNIKVITISEGCNKLLKK